jgi:alpha-L-fucosidase
MSRNWGYIANDTVFKSPELMVRQLLEIVSKGGNLLLNNGPTGEGEIRNEAQSRLKLIGQWMKKNSEGIYGTHPWKVANELLAEEPKVKEPRPEEGSQAMKDAVNDATSKLIIPEVRFTAKGDDLFAYVCSWKGDHVLIKSLSPDQLGVIKKVSLLNSSKRVNWKQTPSGLELSLPNESGQAINIIGFKIQLR